MADIVAATLHSQFGPEVTPGISVSANKQLLSLGFPRWKPMGEGQMLTPQGYKVPTTHVPPGLRWVEGAYDGVIDFNEIEYVLNSVVNSATPTTEAINAKHWTHYLSPAAVDTRQTYTWEQGNNQHAQKATYAFFNSLKLEMTRLLQKASGNLIAQSFTDDITLTSSPTILTPQVVSPQNFDVRIAATQAALAGTQQVETATAAGSATSSANLTATVTAAGMTNSPKAVTVAVLNGDTAATWAGKVRTALAADIDVASFFNVGGSSTSIALTARAAAANDATMNIAIAAGTTGVTAAPTSADTTAGVAAASVYARPFGVTFDLPNVQSVIARMNSSDSSWIAPLDIPTAPIVTFRTDADDAGMGYLSNWSAGSLVFLSVTATGNTISGSNAKYAFTFQAAGYINKGYNAVDDNGNAQAEWELALALDPTWNRIFQIDVVNTLASL